MDEIEETEEFLEIIRERIATNKTIPIESLLEELGMSMDSDGNVTFLDS